MHSAQGGRCPAHGEEEILRSRHDLLEVESIGIAGTEEAHVQLARRMCRCLGVVGPADDGGVPAHRGEPGQNVVVGQSGVQIAQSVPVPLGVVDDETAARRQVCGDLLLDRRGPGDDRIRREAHELAGPRAQTEVHDGEDGHQEQPAARMQDGPEPDDDAGSQAESERDERGLADGVRLGGRTHAGRERRDERRGIDERPTGQRQDHGEGNERDPAVEHPALVRGVRAAIDPTGEEHAGGHGHVDHVAALQALLPIERDGIEEMLEWGVRPEGQQDPDQPDHVPGGALARRQS